MAYLQRIVNGGGHVSREYGVGRGRIDILIRKPYGDHQEQLEAIELKVWAEGRPSPSHPPVWIPGVGTPGTRRDILLDDFAFADLRWDGPKLVRRGVFDR